MSVISRMLQDLESRGASVPLNRPTAPVDAAHQPERETVRAQKRDAGPGLSRLSKILLASGLVAAGVALYGLDTVGSYLQDSVPIPVLTQAQAAAPKAQEPTANAPTATENEVADATSDAAVMPTWRMDLALSLGLIKPRLPRAVALRHAPVNSSDVAVAEPAASAPLVAEVKHTPVAITGERSITIIDPPAVGRSQSAASLAVEAYRRATDLADQGRDGPALSAALQAVKLDAQHLPARRLAIALALDQKQVDQAGALLDEGLQVAPRDGELLFLHARRLALAGANEQAMGVLQGLDRQTGESLGLKAGLLARTGQYAQAAQVYQLALKTRPDNATWWLGLGVALNAQGQGSLAKEAFLRARKLGQLGPDVQAWLDQQL